MAQLLFASRFNAVLFSACLLCACAVLHAKPARRAASKFVIRSSSDEESSESRSSSSSIISDSSVSQSEDDDAATNPATAVTGGPASQAPTAQSQVVGRGGGGGGGGGSGGGLGLSSLLDESQNSPVTDQESQSISISSEDDSMSNDDSSGDSAERLDSGGQGSSFTPAPESTNPQDGSNTGGTSGGGEGAGGNSGAVTPDPLQQQPEVTTPRGGDNTPVTTAPSVTACGSVVQCNTDLAPLYSSQTDTTEVYGLYGNLFNFLTQTQSRGSVSDTIAETIGELNGERVRDCSTCVVVGVTSIFCTYELITQVGSPGLMLEVVDSSARPLEVVSARYRTPFRAPFGSLEVFYQPVTFDGQDFLQATPQLAVRLVQSGIFQPYPLTQETCQLVERCGVDMVAMTSPAEPPTSQPSPLPAGFTAAPRSEYEGNFQTILSELTGAQCPNQLQG